MKVLITVFILFPLYLCQEVRYDFYRLYIITPATERQAKLLDNMIEESSNGVIFIASQNVLNIDNNVLVSPQELCNFLSLLKRESISFRLANANFQDIIDEEKMDLISRGDGFDWESYRTLSEIYNWLDTLAKNYPKIVKIITFGRSFEKRIIKGVKISYKSGNPGVLLEGGMHAREWVSPATVTYLANELLTSNVSVVRRIAANFDWYVVPVFNPDGYVYSHTKDRMWRKTRKPYKKCVGADPNRNFNSAWNTVGVSKNPCTDTYPGPRVFSEVETKSVTDYLLSLKRTIRIYLSFHSYGLLLVYPYGYKKTGVPNAKAHSEIAASAVKSLARRFRTQYEFGQIHTEVYPVSGGSIDWAYESLKVKYAFAYELRPAWNNSAGFVLPANQIIPCGKETLDSVVTIVQEATKRGLT